MAKGNKKQNMPEKPVCEKNQELVLDIVDMGSEGEGIGRADGYALFVKDAIPGDQVKIKVIKTKKRFGYGRMMEIIKPSPYRVTPKCPVAKQCGGCQLQHCSYQKQLSWKEEKVKNCLHRIGGISLERLEEIQEPILAMEEPFYYRNKAQFPVGYDREGNVVTGFYAGRTHAIIPCEDCVIQHPSNKIILSAVLDFMKECHIPPYEEDKNAGLVRHILIRVGKETGEIMVCLIINSDHLPHDKKLVEKLLQLDLSSLEQGETPLKITSIGVNINQEDTNVILGKEVKILYGNSYISDKIGDITYKISPLSFYQVNPEQTKKLYETALEYSDLKGGETVWDLYCGIGTISLFLGKKAGKVCGVEIVPEAIEDAKRNAQDNNMDNVEFFLGAAEDVVPKQYEASKGSLKADVVTLDPPRKGCDEKLLETVVQMNPNKIVYVSCDPGTLARDVKFLLEQGYELTRYRPCDMFGNSYHVETVALLQRIDKNK